jgi:hypothetical protein
LPPDVVLLHIGPHKTGTTTLQGAFHHARKALRGNGVHYAGKRRQPWLAALAVTGRRGRPGDPPAAQKHWRGLVREVQAEGGSRRVFVSSERFADAKPDSIRRIIDELGGPRVHILITLRPLAKILPSQWQQAVRNGLPMPYGKWLKNILTDPEKATVSPSFWTRHAHDKLVERWASIAGPDRVTVLVLDESDREMFLRAVESMLALPSGVLVPQPSLANRSLTQGEVEMLRYLNAEFKRQKWPGQLYARYVRLGAIKSMLEREPGPSEPAITTPTWALERSAVIGKGAAEGIRASGVNVVGDLDALGRQVAAPSGPGKPAGTVAQLPADAAAQALIGTVGAAHASAWPDRYKSMAKKSGAAPAPDDDLESRPIAAASARSLLGVVATRGRQRLRRTVVARVRRRR